MKGFFGDSVSLRRVETIHRHVVGPRRGMATRQTVAARQTRIPPQTLAAGRAEAVGGASVVDVVVAGHGRVTGDQARPTCQGGGVCSRGREEKEGGAGGVGVGGFRKGR